MAGPDDNFIDLARLAAREDVFARPARGVLLQLQHRKSPSAAELAQATLQERSVATLLRRGAPGRRLRQTLETTPRGVPAALVLRRAVARARARSAPLATLGDLIVALVEQRLVLTLSAVAMIRHDARPKAPSRCQPRHLSQVHPRDELLAAARNLLAEEARRRRHANPPRVATPTLDRWGIDLTARARSGIPPRVVGRDAEIDRLLNILCRGRKRNALIIGEPGVGKSALVDGLAYRLAHGPTPFPLAGCRLVSLDADTLRTAGEHSHEVARIMRELAHDAQVSRTILFMDEFHVACRARYAGETPIAAQLKTPLARGAIALIGATTTAEHAAHVQADSALARRFETIMVEELDEPGTLQALEGDATRAGWAIGDPVPAFCQRLVALCQRHLPGRRFPDKALDVLERAVARAHVTGEGATAATLDEIVGELAGVPLGAAAEPLAARVASLPETLAAAVVGQPHAVAALSERLALTLSDLDLHPERPRAVILLAGPSGTGKTQLARAVTAAVLGDQRRLLRLDLSEYADPFALQRLLGTTGPNGTIPGTPIFDSLAAQPFSVLLLDEFDKANPIVQRAWLGAFDAGHITTARHHTIDVRHAIVLLTSNHLANPAASSVGFAPEATVDQPAERAAEELPPELVGRLDGVVRFRRLDVDDASEIIRRLVLPELQRRCAAQAIGLDVPEPVIAALARTGLSPHFGARELHRAAERALLVPLARLLATHGAPLRAHASVEADTVTVRASRSLPV